MQNAAERLLELRAGNGQTCLIRVQPAPAAKIPRMKRKKADSGALHFKPAAFGGRTNFLPAEAPVIVKRSLTLHQVWDLSENESETVAKVCSRALHQLVHVAENLWTQGRLRTLLLSLCVFQPLCGVSNLCRCNEVVGC